ncbi:adenylate kinase family enzyme [Sporosarcina luteola]|nr:adenylate kinase family enzyme [Sporosarcina luteola]
MKTYKRVLIIGSSGAGKSTLSKELAEKTGLPVLHLDALFWKEGWTPTSKTEFRAALQEELEQPEWIIDGNFNSMTYNSLCKQKKIGHP